MATPEQHVTPALTKQTRDGRTVRVDVVHTVNPTDLGRQDDVVLVAHTDGVELGRGWALTHPRDLPAGASAALGRAAFSPKEAEQIEAALHTVRVNVPPNLARVRERLVEALNAAQDIATAAAGRAHDDGELDPYLSPRGDAARHEQAITDALQALEEFDREHPELVAALERRRHEDVKRWAQQ